mmetsp:Transcript_10702/g.31778  ORF Transcript_10702/g.31778 Transcript_10702/m.31778 type:complete len:230 (-) Transcript_10702:543-1232(-)
MLVCSFIAHVLHPLSGKMASSLLAEARTSLLHAVLNPCRDVSDHFVTRLPGLIEDLMAQSRVGEYFLVSAGGARVELNGALDANDRVVLAMEDEEGECDGLNGGLDGLESAQGFEAPANLDATVVDQRVRAVEVVDLLVRGDATCGQWRELKLGHEGCKCLANGHLHRCLHLGVRHDGRCGEDNARPGNGRGRRRRRVVCGVGGGGRCCVSHENRNCTSKRVAKKESRE